MSEPNTARAAPTTWKLAHPLTWRVFHCRCGRPVFFRNTQCLNCATPLGYEPEKGMLVPLQALGESGTPAAPDGAAGDDTGWTTWTIIGDAGDDGQQYRRCANFETAARCNWLVPLNDPSGNSLCRCCRLNRVVPDQSLAFNRDLWSRVEIAKRRLVSSLMSLGLPVASRMSEDNARGMAFDLLVSDSGALPVMTGHHDGIITLNVNEADDSTREAVRTAMHEPYRTVLGHLRHESGHYYWSRLLEGGPWLEPFRALFGDERDDYGAALARHHAEGPPPDWASACVSAYASSHPWEDWAETWAHYLHMLDTLDTALSAGIDSGRVELLQDPFDDTVLYRGEGFESDAADQHFLAFVNAWVELTSVLNELSRSMGLPDFYPFVLSGPAVTKLHFIHRFVVDQRRLGVAPEQNSPSPDAGTVLSPGTGTEALPDAAGNMAEPESVAGEEDPGAALDAPSQTSPAANR